MQIKDFNPWIVLLFWVSTWVTAKVHTIGTVHRTISSEQQFKIEHESLQRDSVALQTWPNTNFFDPSLSTSVWASLCAYTLFSHPLYHRFPSSAAASSPSLIFSLSLSRYITQGINHRLPWRWNHPCRCMCQLDASSVGMFVCLLYTRLYLLFLPPVRAVRPPLVMRPLLHSEWLWQLSRRDALTCHTRLPLSSVQNNDQIQREKKNKKKCTQCCQACLVSFQLKKLFVWRLFVEKALKCYQGLNKRSLLSSLHLTTSPRFSQYVEFRSNTTESR